VNLKFHPEAELEFEKSVLYYKQRGQNLGHRFAQETRSAIARIAATPQRWRILEDDVRRCFIRIFPYAVLYIVEKDHILIIAIAHNKREPGYWHARLSTP